MPEKWTSPWYNKQYQKSNYDTDANIFIGQGHRGAIASVQSAASVGVRVPPCPSMWVVPYEGFLLHGGGAQYLFSRGPW